MEEREPDADEIEAMRASEWAFRLDNYLLDDHAYSAYCEAYAEWWYQFDPPSEEFLAEMRKRAEAPIMRNEAEPPPAETAAVSRGVQVNAIASTVDVPIVRRGKRDQYELTPPEAKFYDALVETGLTFSIQPWTQHVETTFRPDFFVHYGGKVYVVEINGYQFHRSTYDQGRCREGSLFHARGIPVITFTASHVWKTRPVAFANSTTYSVRVTLAHSPGRAATAAYLGLRWRVGGGDRHRAPNGNEPRVSRVCPEWLLWTQIEGADRPRPRLPSATDDGSTALVECECSSELFDRTLEVVAHRLEVRAASECSVVHASAPLLRAGRDPSLARRASPSTLARHQLRHSDPAGSRK